MRSRAVAAERVADRASSDQLDRDVETTADVDEAAGGRVDSDVTDDPTG